MTEPKKRSTTYTNFKTTETELESIFRINSQVGTLVLDYCLAAAILGSIPLLPLPWILEIKLSLLIVLNLKMIIDIGAHWGYAKGQSSLAICFSILGLVGAFAMALMTYITVYSIGLFFFPLVTSWAPAAAYFTLTCIIGIIANQFYLGGKRISPKFLNRARRQYKARENNREISN